MSVILSDVAQLDLGIEGGVMTWKRGLKRALYFTQYSKPSQKSLECFEPCPSMASLEARPASHYALSWPQKLQL